MLNLSDRVAVVTGASKGIGRGVAVGLGESGATVVITGRTKATGDYFESGIDVTAELVTLAGGRGFPIHCDHRIDSEVNSLFDFTNSDLGGVDILVNNVQDTPDFKDLWVDTPFWDVAPEVWDQLFEVGLRSHFVASKYAVPQMIKKGRGLIVNISSVGATQRIGAVLPYGVAKTALDRMTSDMAAEAARYNIAVISLWPPPTSTPAMIRALTSSDDPSYMSLPIVTGRVIAELAVDPEVSRWSGKALRVRDLAKNYGVEDLRYQL